MEGVKKDYLKAAKLLEKACDGNYFESCYNLELLYTNNLGVKQDYHKAAKLFEKACNGKNAQGCYNLGFLYYYRKKDEKKAKEMFVISCGFLCYLVDEKRDYILFLRLRN